MSKLLVLVAALVACKYPDITFKTDAGGNDDGGMNAMCAEQGLPPTTITGTVFAPNGTLPLYGAEVYIPVSDPGPVPIGVQCARCADPLPGGAVARALSDAKGEFVLSNVPVGAAVPLVIQVGKWRKRISVGVTACRANPLTAAQTSLPKTQADGDMPRMAFVSGACDQLECVLRKIGIDDSEFTNDAGPGRVHIYTSMGAPAMLGNGSPLTSATVLWSDLNKLKNYDAMFLGCECSQADAEKTQVMYDNLQAYADIGGRIYATHYQSVWIDGKTGGGTPGPSAAWQSILSCPMDGSGMPATTIDQLNNPKGPSFANWLLNVGASSSLGSLNIDLQARQTCDSVDLAKAERWMYQTGTDKPQMVLFTTPQNAAPAQRCGKVTFSDMHSADSGAMPFPNGCDSLPFSAQQKALAFMIFELSACTGQHP